MASIAPSLCPSPTRPKEEPEMTLPEARSRRILIVEDEFLIAMTLQEWLENVGYVVVGPVPSVEKAMKLIESETALDAAVVDLNLGGVFAYAVADTLLARHVPFVFTSGYEDDVLRTRYPQIRNCHKPYRLAEVQEALTSAMSA
jgi:CheY-like chemotaxis protein